MIDDEENWHEEIKTVKPLRKKKPVVTKVPVVKKAVIRERPRIEMIPEVRSTSSASIPQKRIKQLKQQKIPVEATLDLHGMILTKAHDAVQRFILSAYRQELRCIEIITGIGRTEGAGQLKRLFPMWIQDPSLKPYILHTEINPLSRGGSFLLLLRRHKTRD